MAQEPPKNARSVTGVAELMAKLRDPEEGCPWDLEQTHVSIAPYCLEEAYEVVDAIERGDDEELKSELGDLLLQVVFHARMAEERGAFTLADVCEGLVSKMVRRHPHVFGEAASGGSAGVRESWEGIKAQERAARGAGTGALADVPTTLPALPRAQKLGKRAGRVGFDWPGASGVLAKVREETGEVEAAMATGDAEAMAAEAGDLLFATAQLCRHLKVDAETVLRAANEKFERRFAAVEARATAAGREVSAHSLDELEAYWSATKATE